MTKNQSRSYEIDMCSGPILSKVLRFAVPLMFSSMLQLLFNAADIIVVGRYAGDNALAAVGSNSSLITLLTGLFIGLSVGTNILAARHHGAKEDKELSATVHTSIKLALFSGLLLTLIGLVSARTVLIWMNCPDNVLSLAALYLRIYTVGMTATMLYNFGAAILRASGDTRRPLYYLSLAGVVNIVLNLFFVIVCDMSVAGVAIASVISQYISAFFVLRALTRDPGPCRLELRQLRFNKKKLRQILRIGLPAGLQASLFSLANVVIQSSVNLFGESAMAGNSAANSIEGFVYASISAFEQASASFCSQNMGAGNYQRIWKIFIQIQLCAVVFSLVLGGSAILLGPDLLSIYSLSDASMETAMIQLRVFCSSYALCGLMDVTASALRGVGYNIMPMITTLIGACGLRLLWLATVFQIPSCHNIQTVFLSFPVSWAVTYSAQLVSFLLVYRRLLKKRGNPASLPVLD